MKKKFCSSAILLDGHTQLVGSHVPQRRRQASFDGAEFHVLCIELHSRKQKFQSTCRSVNISPPPLPISLPLIEKSWRRIWYNLKSKWSAPAAVMSGRQGPWWLSRRMKGHAAWLEQRMEWEFAICENSRFSTHCSILVLLVQPKARYREQSDHFLHVRTDSTVINGKHFFVVRMNIVHKVFALLHEILVMFWALLAPFKIQCNSQAKLT